MHLSLLPQNDSPTKLTSLPTFLRHAHIHLLLSVDACVCRMTSGVNSERKGEEIKWKEKDGAVCSHSRLTPNSPLWYASVTCKESSWDVSSSSWLMHWLKATFKAPNSNLSSTRRQLMEHSGLEESEHGIAQQPELVNQLERRAREKNAQHAL